MLFQPSNILPDVINGLGNGTVDVENDGLTVSWQINGNSFMTAYAIFIYQNDVDSTQLYTTGKISLVPPVSGIDYQGNIQRFTAQTISASTLTTAGLSNGNDYKLKIVEYYNEVGAGEKSIEQRSMSVFHARTTPTVTITSPGSTVDSIMKTFTGTYIQAEGDALKCVRWQLYNTTDEDDPASTFPGNILQDTGNMFGVLTLRYDYDSFLNNNTYNLVLTVETENGIVATDSVQFNTSWETGELEITTNAQNVSSQSTGVKITWDGFNYNQGDETGHPTIENGTLFLPSLSDSVVWKGNNNDMNIAPEWFFLMRTRLAYKSAPELVKITTSAGDVTISYNYQQRTLGISKTITSTGMPTSIANVPNDAYVTIGMDSTSFIVKVDYHSNGLVPSVTLTPSNTLVPSDGTEWSFTKYPYTISTTQGNITRIKVGGIQEVDFVQVFGNSASASDIATLKTMAFDYGIKDDRVYIPSMHIFGGLEFSDDFTDGTTNGGILKVANSRVTGWAIYRRNVVESAAMHLMDVPVNIKTLIDYGAGSNHGTYYYDIYPIGETTYLTLGASTNAFSPTNANWAILVAEYLSEGYYNVINEYVFGKNFSSGAVSNNNKPAVSPNFTQYATVQMSNSNYQSGTLSGLIGQVGYFNYIVQPGDTTAEVAARFGTTTHKIVMDNDNLPSAAEIRPGMVLKIFLPEGMTSYFDDKKLRDDIWGLSTTNNHLFLKSRKGDVIEIRIAGEITMAAMDASPQQPLTVSVPWVQIGDASKTRLVGGIS